MSGRATNLLKNRSLDRILILGRMEGKSPTSHSGMVDNTLFEEGGNRLHAKMDIQTSLWYMQYDRGILPEPLKQRFTSFTKLMTFVTEYYKRRNIEIKEVIDLHA